ncbi:collagen alpha-1(XV) chain-like [Portunus trituberculatus]|uniref:collagen alpha-1(XV) chain-like n=1 Tax=Portunus trituberculatus TaxID=210409 RepID=UPI001E1CC60F|nr:collagen alpha-1(XV) chain-like [Portunus trituberculatus]XP_045117425.1 collagen alpha-1(XV) chain-like [Portunus trituberculatus]
MRGVTGVDYTCYREARRAGLSGTFRAFLTSRIQNLDSIVRRDDANLPVVNIKGEVLFNTWRGIFSGDGGRFMQKPRIFSFDGKEVLTSPEWPQKYIWHGSDIDGGEPCPLSATLGTVTQGTWLGWRPLSNKTTSCRRRNTAATTPSLCCVLKPQVTRTRALGEGGEDTQERRSRI